MKMTSQPMFRPRIRQRRSLAALRKRLVLALVACLLVALATTASATADGPDFYQPRGIGPGGSLPLRAAPRADAPAVGRIGAAATCMRSLGCQGGLSLEEFSGLSEAAKRQRLAENPRWCQVLVHGRSGWVPGEALAESAAACRGAASGLALAGTGAVQRRGRIQGDAFVDHVVQGRAGQTLVVALQASHPQSYMNLTPPGSEWAMFVGSTSGDRVERVLPVDGLYVVRVYLMRAAARRNAESRYTLSLRLSGEALQPRDAAQDARIAGTPFHAQAQVPCWRGAAEVPPPGVLSCGASVIRYQRAASAMLELRWNDAGGPRLRRLLLVDGRVVGSDAADAPRMQNGPGDTYRVDVGPDEHYALPHALVSGG